MVENRDSNFKNGIIIALVGAVIGSILTVFGQPYINQVFEEAKTPKLEREYHQTNINSLPDNVKSQISLITTRYILHHTGGGSAEQITVTVTSSDIVPIQSIVVDPSSETNSIIEINDTVKRIEVPVIRPLGKLSFEITHSPNNKIQIDEIIKTGEVVSSDFDESDSYWEWWQYLLLGLFFIALASFLFFVYSALSKGAKYFVSLDSSDASSASEASKSKIASIIVLVLTYNFITRFSIISIDLPSLPIDDIFYGLILYVIITNYKALIALLRRGLGH